MKEQRLRRDAHEPRRLGQGRGESSETLLLVERSWVRSLPLLRRQEESGEREQEKGQGQDDSEEGF